MTEGPAAQPLKVDQILGLMDRQRKDLFADLAGITGKQLWFRAGPGEWSIREMRSRL